jgi:general stress protein 26
MTPALQPLTMEPSMSLPTSHSRAQLWDLIKDTRFAMFTTHHPNGHLHSRPMTTQNTAVDEDDSLWFFMPRGGEPVADIAVDPTVNVAYADPDKEHYVSVSGTAQVVDDAARKQRLWNRGNEAWFPAGPDDPDLALVRVRITHAEYWDDKESRIVQLWEMAKAAVTGKPLAPGDERGAHGAVRMS